MGSNIEKEKKEFEEQYDEMKKEEFKEKEKKQKEMLLGSEEDRKLRIMNIIVYSKGKISDDFISSFCEIKSIKKYDLCGTKIKIGKNPDRNEFIYKFIEEGNSTKL